MSEPPDRAAGAQDREAASQPDGISLSCWCAHWLISGLTVCFVPRQ